MPFVAGTLGQGDEGMQTVRDLLKLGTLIYAIALTPCVWGMHRLAQGLVGSAPRAVAMGLTLLCVLSAWLRGILRLWPEMDPIALALPNSFATILEPLLYLAAAFVIRHLASHSEQRRIRLFAAVAIVMILIRMVGSQVVRNVDAPELIEAASIAALTLLQWVSVLAMLWTARRLMPATELGGARSYDSRSNGRPV